MFDRRGPPPVVRPSLSIRYASRSGQLPAPTLLHLTIPAWRGELGRRRGRVSPRYICTIWSSHSLTYSNFRCCALMCTGGLQADVAFRFAGHHCHSPPNKFLTATTDDLWSDTTMRTHVLCAVRHVTHRSVSPAEGERRGTIQSYQSAAITKWSPMAI